MDGIRRRHRRHRRRLRADPGHLLRRLRTGLPELRFGHRQPQSAGLQRPEDGHRRQTLARRSDSGSAAAHCRQFAAWQGQAPQRRRPGRPTSRKDRRRRQAGAADEDRHRLRQRRRRRIAPELFKRLGCEWSPLFCEVDGNFPNHHPDPSKPENLADVIRALRKPTPKSASPSTATATASAWSPRTARSSTRIAS
jgi:hypothetical protein